MQAEIPILNARDRIRQLCDLLSKSEAAWDASTAYPLLVDKAHGQFFFDSDAAWQRPNKDAFVQQIR